MARWLVADELWAVVEPILPKWAPSPKGGQPRKSDRLCLSGILFVLKTGIPWEDFPQEMGCSGMTLWNRLDEWRRAGLISGLLVYTFAPEAEGHGTDAAIKAYHRGNGIIRPRVPLVKILASAVTIGSGGSGGREGPIAQIGAGFGSFLAQRLGLSAYERRILLAAGMGAGVAAIFRAPLAGAIFATEVLYRDEDFEAEALIPAFISCTAAYCVYGLIVQYVLGFSSGFHHIFSILPGLTFDNPLILGPLTVLALLMAAAAIFYVRTFYGVHERFKRLNVPRHIRPAIGAMVTAALALAIFFAVGSLGADAQQDSLSVLSFGYGIIQKILSGHLAYGAVGAIVVLLAIGLGKILTTSLTIGAGGSGGVFGPSMVIGGALGGAVGLAFQTAMPSVVTRGDVFVILGMAAFFSAAAKTPISTIIIVSEMTGGYELLLPAMWVAALAYLVSGRKYTIYREQVPSRVDSPAHQGEFIVDVLKGLTVQAAGLPAKQDFVTVKADTPLRTITELVTRTTQTVFPVVDADGRFLGLFDLDSVRQFLYREEAGRVIIAEDMMVEKIEPIRLDADLSAVMGRFARTRSAQLPVVDVGSSKVIGLVSRHEVVAAYDSRLAAMRSGKA